MMPFNMSPQQILQRMMQNPQMQKYIQNNPQAQQYAQIILDGNAEKGQEIAQNLCGTYGVTPEQGVQQSQQFFQQNIQNMRNSGFF